MIPMLLMSTMMTIMPVSPSSPDKIAGVYEVQKEIKPSTSFAPRPTASSTAAKSFIRNIL